MTLPSFPITHVNRGPRCEACLQNVPRRRFIAGSDDCSGPCLMGLDVRTMGGVGAHLHWKCDCDYTWATQTAAQSGHDPERQ